MLQTKARFTTFEDAENCSVSSMKLIAHGANGEPDIEAGKFMNIRIKAGEPFTVSAAIANRDECDVVATFQPQAGQTYAAALTLGARHCTLVMTRIDSKGKRIPETTTRGRTRVAGIIHNGKTCI